MEPSMLAVYVLAIGVALVTLVAVLATHVLASKKIEGVRVLVNDQLTREKERSLVAMRAQKLLLGQLLEADASTEDRVILEHLNQEIEALAEEVRRRDRTAEALHRGDSL